MSSGHSNSSSLNNFLHFRRPNFINVLVIQIIAIIAALLVLLGMLYVCVLSLTIVIYHYLKDPEPSKVPEYVRQSAQFEENVSSTELNISDNSGGSDDDGSDTQENPSEFRKMTKLNKFMMKDIDVKRKMQVLSN